MESYNAHLVRELLEPLRDTYEAKLREGQPATWQCDQRTKDLWCLSQLIIARYYDLDGDRRRDLNWMFNRIVRSVEDPFEAAAVVIYVGDKGLNTEDYSQNYWTAHNHMRYNWRVNRS